MLELTNNVEKFGITNFMFWAEEFILDKKFVLELCDSIISSALPIKWVCNSRVDAVDSETLSAIRQAGCWHIAFGIESGDQGVLNQINKHITLEHIRKAVRLSKIAGLQVTGHVIIGFPTDTTETIKATEKFINSLDLDFVQYYCAMPYPGTQLYTEALRKGWLTTTDWHDWEHNKSVLDYEHLKASDIIKLRRGMMLRYYLSPIKIMKTIKNHIKHPSDFVAILSKAREFFQWM
jgi:radical SAM superfamily enzyme YgiQ (UPF0313 family)